MPWILGKRKKQRISEWKQLRGSPASIHLAVWAQPSLLPNTLVLPSPWILPGTSWILLWTTGQAFQRRDIGSQYPCTPLLLRGRSIQRIGRSHVRRMAPGSSPPSITFKTQSPSEARVSVNELGIVFGLYAAQSFYGPLIVYKPSFHVASFICTSSQSRALLSGATQSVYWRAGPYLTGDIAGDPLIFLIGQMYLNLLQTGN